MYLEVTSLLNHQLHLLLQRLLLSSKVRDVTSLTSKDMLSARQLGLSSRIWKNQALFVQTVESMAIPAPNAESGCASGVVGITIVK